MEEENAVLEEVIVVGYGTIKRKEMTSAISHIGAKDLNQMPTMDASMLLQGKVSSVSVSNINSADPDQHGSIQIRGVSSRSAGLGPLIVVDGIPGGDLANINPNDIESMDVLKDGAASAIYGTRGSNGVILINLKKEHVTIKYTSPTTVRLPSRKQSRGNWNHLVPTNIVNTVANKIRATTTVETPIGSMPSPIQVLPTCTRLLSRAAERKTITA